MLSLRYIAPALFAAAACLSPMSATARPEWNHGAQTENGQGPDGAGWGHIDAEEDAAARGHLFPYAECSLGSHQSPIAINLTQHPVAVNPGPKLEPPQADHNLPVEALAHPLQFRIHYDRSDSSREGLEVEADLHNHFVFENNGHGIQIAFSKGYRGRLSIGHDTYHLLQFHFHTPSEHLFLTGHSQNPHTVHYDGEIHFVNQSDDGRLAVVAVLLDGHAANSHSEFDRLIDRLSHFHSLEETGATAFCTEADCSGIRLNPMKLIPHAHAVYTYQGSLTTPPCSENVNWYVLDKPLPVSDRAIHALNHMFPYSNRFTQKVDGLGAAEPRQVHAFPYHPAVQHVRR